MKCQSGTVNRLLVLIHSTLFIFTKENVVKVWRVISIIECISILESLSRVGCSASRDVPIGGVGLRAPQ